VFISYGACFSFVSRLEEIAAKIATVVNTDPSHALELYETFLAGCYEKAGELDDFSGNLDMFVGNLFSGWITARQAAKADPAETANRLPAWMDDDPWGFCQKLESEAVKVMDEMGLAALEKQIRAPLMQSPLRSRHLTTHPDAGLSTSIDAGARRCAQYTSHRRTWPRISPLQRRPDSLRKTAWRLLKLHGSRRQSEGSRLRSMGLID
jgi:hypothetical protein